jgi:hypothetical protein
MVPGLDDRNAYGNRPTGVYVPRFRNVRDEHPDFLRGYGFQGSAGRAGWSRGVGMPGFGADFKEALRQPGPWQMSFGGFGECLPRHSNYVEIDPDEMLEAAGCTDITPYRNEGPPGLTIHEMGTARMGRDPQTSVLNGYNQCHDVPNLFVTDGASMASTACQNPSLTYMALTARACAYAVEQLQRREL